MLRLVALAALALVLVVPASATLEAPGFHVVATNLNNPRKLAVGRDGRIYVAEAGRGGQDRCIGTGVDATCVGRTGSVTRIADGARTRVVTGLASWASPTQQRAQGLADVLVRRSTTYLLFGDAFVTTRGGNRLGRDGASAGRLIAIAAGGSRHAVVADLAAFEAANNPDHGAGPGAAFRNPPRDSNPYAFTAYRGGFAVADAAANDLLWIDPAGKISVLAVFPTQRVRLTKTSAERLGAPAGMTSITVQSVPSAVAIGPDGALYVGELTGRPYQAGIARVWRVMPGSKPSLYASGFTNIADLAFDGRSLLVLEMSSTGLYDATFPGALIRIAPNGTQTVIARKGLVAPTGLAVDHGMIYVSNHGFSAGTGPGPHGEVIRIGRPNDG